MQKRLTQNIFCDPKELKHFRVIPIGLSEGAKICHPNISQTERWKDGPVGYLFGQKKRIPQLTKFLYWKRNWNLCSTLDPAAVAGLPQTKVVEDKSAAKRTTRHNHRDHLLDNHPLSRNSEEETIFEEMSSRRTLFLLTAVCPLLLGKPQYGAAPPVQTPEPAPFVQTPSQISCITTQETVRHFILLDLTLLTKQILMLFLDLGHTVHREDRAGVSPSADSEVQTSLSDCLQELLSDC